MDTAAVAIVITAIGSLLAGAAGLAAWTKSRSDRRLAPRSVAVEEGEGALAALGRANERLEAENARLAADNVRLRTELAARRP